MPGLYAALILFQEADVSTSMQLVPTCIPSVAKRHAKLNGAGTLGFPILMEAHVLVGVGSTTVFDIIT